MTQFTRHRFLPFAAAFLLLALTGLVHGLWTGRWHTDADLKAAAASVATVPLVVGDWKGQAVQGDAESFQQAGAAAYWLRHYDRGDEKVTMILMCGRAGPLAVHSPRDCYGGAGFEMVGNPTRVTVRDGTSGESGEFWTARFRKPGVATGNQLQIYWAWKTTGAWQAPDQPRWAFRGNAFLYKLYAIREADDNDRPDADQARTILQQMLPTLKKSLFSPPAS